MPGKDKTTKAAKAQQSLTQEAVADTQVKTAKTSNGKTGKAKKNNKQEKQTKETKKANENEKTSGAQVNDLKVEVKEPAEVKEPVEVKEPADVKEPAQKLSEAKLSFLDGNDTVEKHECESISEKVVPSGAIQRISKISIGSTKVETGTKQKKSQESRKQEASQGRPSDLRAPSPSLRTRPPSPTFITIESTRRTDSPQMVTSSPILLYRPATPPTPPPRRSDTPTLRITRITPSPTFDRVESLARLKDTTAKLSRGVTPPPILQPQPVTEKRSEIVASPVSFHRQIKIESQTVVVSETLDKKAECKNEKKVGKDHEQEKPVDERPKADVNPVNIENNTNAAVDKSADAIQVRVTESTVDVGWSFHDIELDANPTSEQAVLSVKDKKVLFEEAQKAEINKTYVRKNPIDIPERLGPEVEDFDMGHEEKEIDEPPRVDLSSLVNRFEISEERVYTRKEPISLSEHLDNETQVAEANKTSNIDILEQEIAVFDIQAIKNVFKLDEQCSMPKTEKSHQDVVVLNSAIDRPRSKNHQHSRESSRPSSRQSSRQNTPVHSQRDVAHTESSEPTGCSETSVTTEHFSNVNQFGNKTVGTKTVKTVSESSESISDIKVPFSYADVVKRKAAKRTETYDEASTEELLRNFHKTWTESETVFKSLGYCVTEEKTSEVVTQLTESESSRAELCAVCRRRVYPMDALIMDKKKYHKSCFCCEHCSSILSLGNSISLHGHLYCPAHYKQLLKSKGTVDGLGQPAALLRSPDQTDWRNSVSSLDSAHLLDDTKPNASKMSVVWPPHAEPLMKGFKMEEDIQLTKPQWPPPDNAPKSPKQQHRKAVPKSVI
ncbi:hypothetical protein CRUP_028144 [Coryphaenoides rupestris]|nr:hypothetical protein CRUP_028144 [Coryphaenoides rupestris]